MSRDVLMVDTNVFLRYFLQDIPDHAERSTRLLLRAQAREVELFAPSSVFVELSHYLSRTLRLPRERVAAALLDLLSNPGISTDHPEALQQAIRFWSREGPLSFPDCFHLALTRHLGMTRIVTFDQKMDRYPGVERVEP
jgi:predicted nucleic acid-binding protein